MADGGGEKRRKVRWASSGRRGDVKLDVLLVPPESATARDPVVARASSQSCTAPAKKAQAFEGLFQSSCLMLHALAAPP